MKRLYRSEENRIFAGVIGGIEEYLAVDPAFLRVIWIVILIFTGLIPGLIVYMLAIFVIPKQKSATIETLLLQRKNRV